MENIITGAKEICFSYGGMVYLPFHGNGFSNSYFQKGPFSFSLESYNGGTSGPDGIFIGNKMCFFLTDRGGRIESDGENIKIIVPEGQQLLIMDDNRSENERWKVYKEHVQTPQVRKVTRQKEWIMPEYVTWVEQRYVAFQQKKSPREVLDEEFVLNFMNRIDQLHLPKGKLTIDDGWQQINDGKDADWTDGYWRPDPIKFPKFRKTIETIQKKGFTPSLWMGIPSVPMQARIISERPDLFDLNHPGGKKNCFYLPGNALIEHYKEILRPYVDMGIRKFKFDFFYGERERMRKIMSCVNQAVREIDQTVEIESHHADPFFSCYCDTFRLNDVHTEPGLDWRGLTLSHIYLANHIATDCIINLDHLGGNSPFVTEDIFLEHMKLYDFLNPVCQYPVLSLLPDRYSNNAVKEVMKFIDKHLIQG